MKYCLKRALYKFPYFNFFSGHPTLCFCLVCCFQTHHIWDVWKTATDGNTLLWAQQGWIRGRDRESREEQGWRWHLPLGTKIKDPFVLRGGFICWATQQAYPFQPDSACSEALWLQDLSAHFRPSQEGQVSSVVSLNKGSLKSSRECSSKLFCMSSGPCHFFPSHFSSIAHYVRASLSWKDLRG